MTDTELTYLKPEILSLNSGSKGFKYGPFKCMDSSPQGVLVDTQSYRPFLKGLCFSVKGVELITSSIIVLLRSGSPTQVARDITQVVIPAINRMFATWPFPDLLKERRKILKGRVISNPSAAVVLVSGMFCVCAALFKRFPSMILRGITHTMNVTLAAGFGRLTLADQRSEKNLGQVPAGTLAKHDSDLSATGHLPSGALPDDSKFVEFVTCLNNCPDRSTFIFFNKAPAGLGGFRAESGHGFSFLATKTKVNVSVDNRTVIGSDIRLCFTQKFKLSSRFDFRHIVSLIIRLSEGDVADGDKSSFGLKNLATPTVYQHI